MSLIYRHSTPVKLEMGGTLPQVEIAFTTYGKLNPGKNNVVWICHALTANADAASWWHGLVGPGCFIDPNEYFIVCANILGSCYGTTSPRSDNPETGEPYGLEFPLFTVRDTVHLHEFLAKHLGIRSLHILMGGSSGGSQALEMALLPSFEVENLLLIATSAKESAWNIAIHESQRMALKADISFADNKKDSGRAGLKAARAIGILSYRTNTAFDETQSDEDKLDNFKASSYIQYQGEKLADRFHAHNYWYLTKCLDSHNTGRNRGGTECALQSISANTCIIGIHSDRLMPINEQKYINNHIPNSTYFEITSDYGHDGFLLETEKIASIFLKSIIINDHGKRNLRTGT